MTHFSSVPVVFLSIALGTVGCAEAPDTTQVGEIAVPLTATGASGAVYRLPAGTSLSLFSDPVFASFPLDGDSPSLTVTVSPRIYSAQLFTQSGIPDTWPLLRQNTDGTTETVQATLDPIPQVTVVENQTTSLTIRFHVAPAGGGIIFQTGSVQVGVEVDDVAPFQFTIDMPSLTTSVAQITDATPAALAARLPALGSAGQRYLVVARTTGAWTLAGADSVCAPVTTTFEATGQAQFVDFLIEATPPDGVQICLTQVAADDVAVNINFFRFGSPVTSLLSDLTTRDVDVFYVVETDVGANVFDGTTLRLDGITGDRLGSSFLFGDIQALGPDNTFERWFELEEDGAATLSGAPL
jgi:hypothetical protein